MSTTDFKDHFSTIASSYAAFRPEYPPELFAWIAGQVAKRKRAWDVGTGNGQAAIGLAGYFDEVIATDASAEQIALAKLRERVTYRVAPCDASGLEPGSVDLVTSAAAAHWFPHEAFHAEVRRVVPRGGVIAFWTYWMVHVSPAIDAWIERLQYDIVETYWPPERRFVNDAYRSLPFPFAEFSAPAFATSADWAIDHFIGYLGTWSAVQRYREVEGRDPVAMVERDLRNAWGEGIRTVRWPLALRIGRV